MANDKIVVGYKFMILQREDGSRYIKTKNKYGEDVTEQDMATFSMYLQKEQQEIMKGFEPDVEKESEESFD
jgi:hypothetical protein